MLSPAQIHSVKSSVYRLNYFTSCHVINFSCLCEIWLKGQLFLFFSHCGGNSIAATSNQCIFDFFSQLETKPAFSSCFLHISATLGVLFRHVVFHISRQKSATSRMFAVSEMLETISHTEVEADEVG